MHQDRTFKGSLDFTEYQQLAQESIALAAEENVNGQRQISHTSLPLQGVESVRSISTPSKDSGTEREVNDENETSQDDDSDEEPLLVSSERRQVAKRRRSLEDSPTFAVTYKKNKKLLTSNSE